MNRSQRLVVLGGAACAACGLIVWGANSGAGRAAGPDAGGTELERWVLASRSQLAGGQAPQFCAAVLRALADNRHVTDATVLACVEAFQGYESDSGSGRGSFPQTLRFMDGALAHLEDRPFLKARLLARQAMIRSTADQMAAAIETWRTSVTLLDGLQVQVDKERITTINHLADALYAQGEKKQAEERYLEVLSYPWYNLLRDPEAMNYLRSQYIRAGHGLINCRRDRPEALKEIYFVPATRQELNPVLQKAIREARP